MNGSCPRCRTPIELLQSGAYTCPRCRLAFQAYLTVPPVREPPLPERAEEGEEVARCALHANNRAGEVCERCGDFMCSLCATPFEGRSYCARCFDLLWDRGAMGVTQRAFTTPSSARTVGIVALVLFWVSILSIPLALVAIVMGVQGLRQIGRQPDLPGRGSAIAGIVLGATALLTAAGFYAFMMGLHR